MIRPSRIARGIVAFVAACTLVACSDVPEDALPEFGAAPPPVQRRNAATSAAPPATPAPGPAARRVVLPARGYGPPAVARRVLRGGQDSQHEKPAKAVPVPPVPADPPVSVAAVK